MDECIHGMGHPDWCSLCLRAKRASQVGRLNTVPYLIHIRQIFKPKSIVRIKAPSGEVKPAPKKVDPDAPRCQLCAQRGANRRNRVEVRLPRIQDGLYGKGETVKDLPPTWEGPCVTRPRIWLATHQVGGVWICDRCCRGCDRCKDLAPEPIPDPSNTRSTRSSGPKIVADATALFGAPLTGLEASLRD